MGGAGGGMTGYGDVDYTAKPPNMQMSMELGPQTVGMLLVDKIMYVESSQAPGKYIKFDLDDPANPLGSRALRAARPRRLRRGLHEGRHVGDVVGQRGRRRPDTLDRYELTVDTTKLADDGTGSSAALPPEVTMVVWLDDEGRMAKTLDGARRGPVRRDALGLRQGRRAGGAARRPGGQPARLLTAPRRRSSPSRSASAEASKRPTGGARRQGRRRRTGTSSSSRSRMSPSIRRIGTFSSRATRWMRTRTASSGLP